MRATLCRVSPLSGCYETCANSINSLPYVLPFADRATSLLYLFVTGLVITAGASPIRYLQRANTVDKDGSDFMGERLTVQFARGSRAREPGGFGGHERAPPRPRRTPHRMQLTGLPPDTSRQVGLLSTFSRSFGSHGRPLHVS